MGIWGLVWERHCERVKKLREVIGDYTLLDIDITSLNKSNAKVTNYHNCMWESIGSFLYR